jgi:hypothetical protein
MTVLQVDDADYASAAHDGHGEECFIAVFREFVEELETRIGCGVLGNRDRFLMFGDPSGNSLPDAKLKTIDDVRVGILGSAKDEFIAFEHVDEAGVTLYEGSGKVDDTSKNIMKVVGRAEANGDLMKHINV